MIVLASGSPRRRELMGLLGVPFEVRVPDVDESVRAGERARDYVRRLAESKATAVPASRDELVIAADTTVEIRGEILGKPLDDSEAISMLRRLQGEVHQVHTGLCAKVRNRVELAICTTEVLMSVMNQQQIEWYVATGEPGDKAGAYAIQGIGGMFVDRVDGNVQNVIGFPLTTVRELAARVGHRLPKIVEKTH